MRFSLHGGHNSIVQGANYGGRKEHVMDRQVKDAVAGKLRSLGHTVYDDTDEAGSTQGANLRNIVTKCNSHDVDLVVSFHLNAYNGSAHGVEVCYYDNYELASKVSAQLSKDIGWYNRGAKERKELYVLANTKASAILLELGFIDNDGDMAKWDTDKIANSIVYALTGQTAGGYSESQRPQSNEERYNYRGIVRCTSNINLRSTPAIGDNVIRVLEEGSDWEFFYKTRKHGEQWFWYNLGGDQFVREDVVREV